jgi:tryptophan 2,3-dioxygenase
MTPVDDTRLRAALAPSSGFRSHRCRLLEFVPGNRNPAMVQAHAQRLHELGEKLVQLEDYLRRWRFNHVTPILRLIGFKRRTGGTADVPHLRTTLAVVLFAELWHVRGER